jgi:hypothetical protein
MRVNNTQVDDEMPEVIDKDPKLILQADDHNSEDDDLIEMEFKVGGMTCVACSSSIERLMHNEFDGKGLVSASVVLLTHKLTTTFKAQVF